MATLGRIPSAGENPNVIRKQNLLQYLKAAGIPFTQGGQYAEYSWDPSFDDTQHYIPWNADGTIDMGGVGNDPNNSQQKSYQTYLTANPTLQPKEATIDELLAQANPTSGVEIKGALAQMGLTEGQNFTYGGKQYSVSGGRVVPASAPLPSYAAPTVQAPTAPTTGTPSTGTGTGNGTGTGGTGTGAGTGTGSQTGPVATTPQQINLAEDPAFQSWLDSLDLDADQKLALKSVYSAILLNDQESLDKTIAAMQAASQYSEPYFKAQVSLVTDALSRAYNEVEGDLQYKETRLNSILEDVRRNTEASKDYLSFKEQQELKALDRKLETDLEDTRQGLAKAGFTNSSRRAQKETYLNETYGDLREGTTRAFGEQTRQMDDRVSTTQRDTALELARLQEIAQQNKTSALRSAEEQVGTSNLSGLGYTGLLGGQGGEIPRQQYLDQLSFAQGFVF